MENQSLWYLENIDITGIFCPTKIGDNENHVANNYKKGEYIYLPEEDSNKIYFVLEGRVKIGAFGENGKEITKAILGKGEVFGELAAIGEEKRRDFALTMEKTTVCVLPATDIKSMIKENRGLSTFLMNIMGRKMQETEQRLESLVFKDSRSRIIEFLHNLAIKKGQRVGFEMVVRNFITHQEIANDLATSREVISRLLKKLAKDGQVQLFRGRLKIMG